MIGLSFVRHLSEGLVGEVPRLCKLVPRLAWTKEPSRNHHNLRHKAAGPQERKGRLLPEAGQAIVVASDRSWGLRELRSMANADEPIVLSDDDDEPVEPPAKRRSGKEPEAAAGGSPGAGPSTAAQKYEVIEIEDVQVRCCACKKTVDIDDTMTSAECSHPVCADCLTSAVQAASTEGGTSGLGSRLVCPCSEPACSGQLRFWALGLTPKGAVKQDAPVKLERQLFNEVHERSAAARAAGSQACSCGAQTRPLSNEKVRHGGGLCCFFSGGK